MNRISRNLTMILRAERMIARRNMAVFRNQTGLMVFAGMVTGIAVVMFNIAGFFALRETMSPQAAAVIIALVNLVIAASLAGAASKLSATPELEPITEMRDLAIEDIEADLLDTVQEVREVAANVQRIARDPLGTALPALIIPALTSFLRNNRKGKGDT